MSDTTRLIFLRHGETTWNAEDRLQGQQDSPLSPMGWQQTHLAAGKVAAMNPDVIYSSDLSRAHAAAELVAQKVKAHVVAAPELRERNFGQWEGVTTAEVRRLYPMGAKAHRDDPTNFRPPGGESRADVCERVAGFLDRIVEQHEGQTVFLSTHGGPIKAAVCHALGCEAETWLRLVIDNASLTIIERRDGRLRLAAMNDTSHLPPQPPNVLEESQEQVG